jgi:hypothetical protein
MSRLRLAEPARRQGKVSQRLQIFLATVDEGVEGKTYHLATSLPISTSCETNQYLAMAWQDTSVCMNVSIHTISLLAGSTH